MVRGMAAASAQACAQPAWHGAWWHCMMGARDVATAVAAVSRARAGSVGSHAISVGAQPAQSTTGHMY